MKWYLATPVLLALAACGTPQQQCIRLASHDLIVLDRLIAETQGNIARGFGYEQKVETVPTFGRCGSRFDSAGAEPEPGLCFDDVEVTVTRPVAIDLQAEAAKLASMQKRRAEISRSLEPAVAQCQARYPE